jgi:hypothetical protein
MKFKIAVSTVAIVFVVYGHCSAYEMVNPNDSEVLRAAKSAVYADVVPGKSCNKTDLISTLTVDSTSNLCGLNYSPTSGEFENVEVCSHNQPEMINSFERIYNVAGLQYGNMSAADKDKFCNDGATVVHAWMQKRKPDEPEVITGKRDVRGISTGMTLSEAVTTLQKNFKECVIPRNVTELESASWSLKCNDKNGYNGDILVYVTKTEPKRVWYIRYKFSAPDTSQERLRATVRLYNLLFVQQINMHQARYKLPSGEVFGWAIYGEAPGSILQIEIADQELKSADDAEAERIRRGAIPEPKL